MTAIKPSDVVMSSGCKPYRDGVELILGSRMDSVDKPTPIYSVGPMKLHVVVPLTEICDMMDFTPRIHHILVSEVRFFFLKESHDKIPACIQKL